MEIENVIDRVYEILDERKAKDIKVIDITGLSIMTDYFVVASAGNINHVYALVDHIEEELHKLDVYYTHLEGYKSGNWVLMDYGDFVIHIFDETSRDFYDIERLWRDGKIIK